MYKVCQYLSSDHDLTTRKHEEKMKKKRNYRMPLISNDDTNGV